ncbi:hypothetical protein Tco_0846539 [Tanacetum coccineum]
MSSSSSLSHATVTYTSISIPAPEYPKYLAPSDDDLPAEDQPLPANASPTALSPGYIADSEPIKDDFEEDSEEDPAYYPSEEEEEEPLAPTNSASPTSDSIPSYEEMEPFEEGETATTPPPPVSPHTIVPLS